MQRSFSIFIQAIYICSTLNQQLDDFNIAWKDCSNICLRNWALIEEYNLIESAVGRKLSASSKTGKNIEAPTLLS